MLFVLKLKYKIKCKIYLVKLYQEVNKTIKQQKIICKYLILLNMCE